MRLAGEGPELWCAAYVHGNSSSVLSVLLQLPAET